MARNSLGPRSAIARSPVALLVLAAAACSSNAGTGNPGAALTGIAISPASATLTVGSTQTLIVEGSYSDGSTAPISSGITWASATTSVATVNANGVVTAVAQGSDSVTATAQGQSASCAITVSATIQATSVIVFDDNYGPGVSFDPYDTVTVTPAVDTSVFKDGAASLRIDVPSTNYVGGAFKSATEKDLSGFNALTFWAKASVAGKTLETAGIGNDATDTTYQAELDTAPDAGAGILLTTDWQQFTIPIPDPAKLTAEDGLFFVSEGSDQGAFSIWFDDIEYATLAGATLGTASAAMPSSTQAMSVGDTYSIAGLTASFAAAPIPVKAAPGYFDFTSSDASVATVSSKGVITAVAVGTATITARLGSAAASGSITVNVSSAFTPSAAAPTPGDSPGDVISLLSASYTGVPVDDWLASWSPPGTAESDVMIGGQPAKKYVFSAANYIGIEFTSHTIDASSMDSFHLDVWTHDASLLKVKLVDFGANGVYDQSGGDDSESELTYTPTSNPALADDSWVSLDIPFSAFTGLAARAHLAQLVISSSAGTLYFQNLYFHTGNHGYGGGGGAGGGTGGGSGGGSGGGAASPGPSLIFGDNYGTNLGFVPFSGQASNVSIDGSTFHSGSASLLVPVPASGQPNIGGAIVSSTAVDMSGYDSVSFWVKASAAHTIGVAGFGDDAAGHATYAAAAGSIPVTTSWTQVNLPIPDPSKLTSQVGLFYFSTVSSDTAYSLWFDDIEYGNLGAAITDAAPAIATETLTLEAGATHPVDGCSASYSVNGATVTESTVAPAYFSFTASAPQYATVSAAGLITAVAATPGDTAGDTITATLKGVAAAGAVGVIVQAAAGAPTSAAPTPTAAAADVISLYSDAYTNVPVQTWLPSGSSPATIAESDSKIAGVDTKKYTNLSGGYAGVDISTGASNELDLTSYTTMHVDIWSPQTTIDFKLADFADGTATASSAGDVQETIAADQWNSLEIPLATFQTNGLTARAHIAQLLFVSNVTGDDASTIYLENIYFHK